MIAQNLKPAVKTRPHHGVAGPGQFNQFNTINWYQQTWHTIEFSNNRHTRHHHNQTTSRRSLRSNFPNLPESKPHCKPASPRSTAQTRIPTRIPHAIKAPFSRPFRRGSVAFFPHQRRRLELLYTARAPHANAPASEKGGPEIRGIPGISGPQSPLTASPPVRLPYVD